MQLMHCEWFPPSPFTRGSTIPSKLILIFLINVHTNIFHRERNRVLARKTRLRKKSFFEVCSHLIAIATYVAITLFLDYHKKIPLIIKFKFIFSPAQTLQKQVAQLAIENDMLKGIVRQRLGGSKNVSSVQNAPLASAEVRLNYCANKPLVELKLKCGRFRCLLRFASISYFFIILF